MYDETATRASFVHRAGAALDRAEGLYLKVLRAVILLIATVLLIYAAWLAASSVYKISRSPDSVVTQQSSVGADEITNAKVASEPIGAPSKGPTVNPEHRDFYKAFAQRYYNLYRSKFEPYRQKDDKQLSLDEFDDSFLNTSARLDADTKGDLNFDDDKADLQTMLSVMREAANKPLTRERLRKYQAARKVPVTKQVERTKTSYRQGWDSMSTNCEYWYQSPIGCPVTRPVETTYTENVTELQYPKGTQSHVQIFKAFQDRYFDLLQQRRDANAAKAERDRRSIVDGIASGKLSLVTTLELLGGFLILMFFFLLIAIERHQRRLADLSAPVR